MNSLPTDTFTYHGKEAMVQSHLCADKCLSVVDTLNTKYLALGDS
jgi:hypothetical protein